MSATTISRGEHDRIVRGALACVFALTPLDLYIYLGGDPEAFDEVARSIMEWWLRSHGYAEEDMAPAFWSPRKRLWVRREVWPEDAPWTYEVTH
ncbi:MAG: hypothetical protein BroJett024_08820 [Alphaproteobacteria bacterium]|nr:MAG: hypothetical protein BroJett024_08820 [Alphaproteobacteria bacterium]